MAQDILNSYEEKGLACPFVVSKAGEAIIAQSGKSIKREISQMAIVIFETIDAVGSTKIERIEMFGEAKGLIMEITENTLVGSLFGRTEGLVLNDLWTLLDELKKQQLIAEKPGEKVREKPKIKLEPIILDEVKKKLKDYLGDFTERIYKNQLKAQHIKVDDFYDDDARRLIFALGKAAGMIIGPSKGREMTNKLLELLK